MTHKVMDIPLISGMLSKVEVDQVVVQVADRVVDQAADLVVVQAVDRALEVLILVLPDRKRCFALRDIK